MQPKADSSNTVEKSDAPEQSPPARPPPPFLPTGELGRRRALLNAAVSAVLLAVLHGAHAVFPVALVCGAFALGHAVKGTRLAQPVAWTMAVALIWVKEKWYGALTFERVLGEGFAGLDGFRGLHPWRLSFNLAVLRIVSFSVDLHWAERERQRADHRVAGAAAAAATATAARAGAASSSTDDGGDDQVRFLVPGRFGRSFAPACGRKEGKPMTQGLSAPASCPSS